KKEGMFLRDKLSERSQLLSRVALFLLTLIDGPVELRSYRTRLDQVILARHFKHDLKQGVEVQYVFAAILLRCRLEQVRETNRGDAIDSLVSKSRQHEV